MSVKLYCPETLDMDAIMLAHPRRQGIKKDSLLFIVHSIVLQKAQNNPERWEKLGKKDGFVPLYSKVLEQKVPIYWRHLDYLIDAGIIECDNDYVRGVISKGYRFTAPFMGVNYKHVDVHDFILCRKIKADRAHSRRKARQIKYPYLGKWFRTGQLQIDKRGAWRWLQEQEGREIGILAGRGLPRARSLKEMAAIREKYTNQRLQVTRIAEHDYYYSVDDTGHRLHTNLTNLPRELRDFITYDGRPLVSIDIKNSQPYMSMALFEKKFWQSNLETDYPTLRKVNEDLYRKVRQADPYLRYSIMFVVSSGTLIRRDFQTEVFFRNIINGSIYEHLLRVFESEGPSLGSTPVEKRTRVKQIVLTVLFDDDWKVYNRAPGSYVSIFRRHFPRVAKGFAFVKGYGYRQLSILLQRIESFLVLGKVCQRISQERPEIPLFTIHDNIVTTVGNEEYVKSVMRDELARIMGDAPQLKVEYWKRPVPAIEVWLQRLSYFAWAKFRRA